MNNEEIKLQPEFEKAVLDLGFSEFTEIQEKCIPLIQQGRDVIGLSHTGSGKTAAFGFPALEKVSPGHGLQLLVIVPTRELCNQVTKEFRKFTKYRKTYITEVYGGVSINPQFEHLKKADVVIGTPGRLLDHLTRRTIDLRKIKILILDEADKMFEMGFIEDINRIISQIPQNSQKLLFSATMSTSIHKLVQKYMDNPETIKMPIYVDKSKLIQNYYNIDRKDKFSLLVHILKPFQNLVIIFCSTRRNVDYINNNLRKQNFKAEAIHGGLTQAKRKQVMDAFRDNKLQILVASDVAARGLDIKNVDLIVNYDLPKTSQEYVHRIGRTARAGCEGKVISLLSSEDHDNFRHVLQDRSLLINKMETPKYEIVKTFRPQNFQNDGSRGGFQRQSNSPRRFPPRDSKGLNPRGPFRRR